jgi:hypothetical protein
LLRNRSGRTEAGIIVFLLSKPFFLLIYKSAFALA